MDILHALIGGIFVALEPINLGLAIIGVIVGLFVGAMPGLGSVNGVAILLPFTFVIQNFTGGATSPMIFLAAIYYGAMYGGAISSITLGIPGASTAVATTFDGRPMALSGRAHVALVTAALASFAGGTISNVLFTGFAPMLASVALSFGNPEIFALMLLAFATFVGLGGDDIPKTIFSICIGLVLATVGFDIISGEPRLIFFDITGFSHGFRFLVLAIGVYGIGEMLWTINSSRDGSSMSQVDVSAKNILDAVKEFPKAWRGTMIGSAMGFFVGILPAAGATPGSLMSYGVTKLTSKDPDSFGKGAIDGVAAPEAANNSASTGAMLPMMTLGIPGSPTTAVLLAGMVIWGLQPGPLLFTNQPDFVWPLIGSFYISNIIAVLVNLAFIPIFLWMLRMPFTILAPVIFVLSLVGTYAAYLDLFDVGLMVIVGLVAFVLRILDYPLAPAVLAIVLGPIAEPKLRQSLLLSDGDWSIFFTRPIAGPITVVAIILILLPLLKVVRDRFRRPQASA
ncbi:tripartite tricarboxylate transporter permease [Paracoccaceae bacterium]|jgi:putative tricarboxylic transport membrane protein|nr:tripartite tricarboxylate transporter permease [Paracoccaceae bacterium]MDE2632596.1 tripartite tricarboxylate transporter permease [Paracoccaceae bacterium]HBR61470.1 tricarboxylate transporter [Paracoccaceae bacterium]|tara:strand:- start:3536 stop:5065 length:1530 start_codon:yes stop_codon:yes gene_type:complete